MNKRILITSTELMMVQFLVPHVISLAGKGYSVDLACSEVGGRFEEVCEALGTYTDNIFRLSLHRSPLSMKNLKGFRELREIITRGNYDLIWTNEPVMGVATRLAAREARKRGTKLLYMVHGFHFYDGAPWLNWCLYYPVERLMARHAYVICTVNTEDFRRACTLKTSDRVEYIHGIGINTARLKSASSRTDIRRELGLPESAFIVLSVGELNDNKNQSVIIRAISSMSVPDMHYVMCGKGRNEQQLRRLAEKLGIEDRVHFLGYRRDVVDICSQADVYAMPSFREGLPVSSLEAMFCGLPLVTSEIRGLTDVNKDGVNGFLCSPHDWQGFASRIYLLYTNPNLRVQMSARNKKDVLPYTIGNTLVEVYGVIRKTIEKPQ